MIFKDTISWLVVNNYVEIHKGKPVFTQKARDEMKLFSKAAPPPLPSLEKVSTPAVPSGTIEEQYKQFIALCNIPHRSYDSYGRPYALNKFSVEGVQAFKKAIQKGYNLQVLAVAVTLYYKSNIQFKKAIGNYMSSGEWETDYDTILQKQKEGTLKEHVKTEMNGSTVSWFTRG